MYFQSDELSLYHRIAVPVLWLAWGVGWLASSRWSGAEKRRQTSRA